MADTMVRKIAGTLLAVENCRRTGNAEWERNHLGTLDNYAADLPSGAGWDCGTKIDASSTPNRIVLTGSYRHMNDGGMYDGWTEHAIIVTPDLFSGFNLRITGRNRNEIKGYIADIFREALEALYTAPATVPA